MTKPPETPTSGIAPDQRVSSSAVLSCVRVMSDRSEFLAAARAKRQGTNSMMVQMRKRGDSDTHISVGFTCSKKVGNAVARNRAKRRLREAARLVIPDRGQAGCDYVLIGRAKVTSERPFDALVEDLRYALRKLHGAS